MIDRLDTLLFGIYPYIALVVLAVGCIVRYDREPYTWRAGSTQLLRRRLLISGSVLFHTGVLIVFLGHLIGLLTPIGVFDALGIDHGRKQWMAIIIGGVAGAVALAGATLLAWRRFFDARVRAQSTFSDNLVIAILWIQLALGLLTIPFSLQHLDGAQMVKLMAWAQGIFTFDPNAAAHVAGAHPVFKAHLVLGLTIFLLLPFTRLVHMLSVPVRYLWRPGYQVVRARSAPGR